MSELSDRTINIFSRLRLNCLSSVPSEQPTSTAPTVETMYLRSQSHTRNDELFNAIHTGDADRCKELLAMGAVNLQEGDYASCPPRDAIKSTLPLHFAVMHRQPEIVKELLRHGAEPDWADIEGKTAIHTLILYWPRCVPKENQLIPQELAVYHGYLRAVNLMCSDTLRSLCAYGGSPNAQDNRQQSPLHYAARYDIPGAAKILLRYGACKEARDIDRKTPVMLAAAMGHCCLEELLQAKTDVHLTCSQGKTALHHAVESRCPLHKKEACVRKLLRNGASPNATDNNRQTPLHAACRAADESIITRLLGAGADADIRDSNGINSLHVLLDLNSNNHPLRTQIVLKLVDATLWYRLPDSGSIPASLNLPGAEPLIQALLTDRAPPSLQRICRKVLRTLMIANSSSPGAAMEENLSKLPLPKCLQRFLLLDVANPIRQIVLVLKNMIFG